MVVYYLCSLGSVNKNRLVDPLVVGRLARKENKVFSFHSLHDIGQRVEHKCLKLCCVVTTHNGSIIQG